MKKTFLKCTLIAAVSGALVLGSCQKLKDDATQTSQSGEDAAQDMSYINAMVDMVEDVAGSEDFMMKKKKKKILPDNVPIKYIDTSFTDGDGIEIRINFGKIAVTCLDGFDRSGSVIVRADKPFSQVGCVIQAFTIGSLNLQKDGNTVGFFAEEGVDMGAGNEHITMTRIAPDKLKAEYIIEVVYDLVDPEDSTRSMENESYPATGDFSITQMAGQDEAGVLGNEYSISGSATGQNHSGTKYTISVTEDLYRKVDPTCSKTLTKGKMTLKNEGAKTDLKIDFGDGTCDNKITIVLPGGVKKDYTLQ